jgi:hypothetical protein
MHNLVKFITDDDGEPMDPLWHFPVCFDGSDRAICNGLVFGEGEGRAKFQVKQVKKGGITCPRCLEIIKMLKKVKL